MPKTAKKQHNARREEGSTKKYQCKNCMKPTNTIRVDVELPVSQRIWSCDKCYFQRK